MTDTFCYESGGTGGGGVLGFSLLGLGIYHFPPAGGSMTVSISGSVRRLDPPAGGACCQFGPISATHTQPPTTEPSDGEVLVYFGHCLDVFSRFPPAASRALIRGSVTVTLTTNPSGTEAASGRLGSLGATQGFAACAADFNTSGATTVQDIFDFLAAWFAGTPASDFNLSGAINVQDIFDFLAAWFAGC